MQITHEQISFAIQSLIVYANIALKNNDLTRDLASFIRKQCLLLLEQLKVGKMDGQKGSEELNRIIHQLNESFTQKNKLLQYPLFETRNLVQHFKGDVIAFELFLAQELHSKKVPLAEEKEIFKNALFLWQDVGASLTPKQGVSKLSTLISRFNTMLPKEEQYPLPDEKKYTETE